MPNKPCHRLFLRFYFNMHLLLGLLMEAAAWVLRAVISEYIYEKILSSHLTFFSENWPLSAEVC